MNRWSYLLMLATAGTVIVVVELYPDTGLRDLLLPLLFLPTSIRPGRREPKQTGAEAVSTVGTRLPAAEGGSA